MGAKNTVTAGDYKGGVVGQKTKTKGSNELFVLPIGLFTKKIPIDNEHVEFYEVIDEESRASATSAVTRGAIGAALLGPIGIAAALSAKKKGLHTVVLQFKDGKSSVVEIDKEIYQTLILILPKNSPIAPVAIADQPMDAAAEIAKYKTLLDNGAITQEEYEAKKKQLLGL